MNGIEDVLQQAANYDVDAAARAVSARTGDLADAEGLVDVATATLDSPVGELLVAVTERGVVCIAYDADDRVLEVLAGRVSPRVLEVPRRVDPVRRQLDEYFEGHRRRFEVDIDWALTSGFGRDVLTEAVRIPSGEVATYGELAARSGHPGAARATGNAMASNPIPIVLPCHRVVPAGGGIGKYGGGAGRKAWLLDLERSAS
jgi:methylated-DNA-[protein]-cysteine S-methyltransferase